MLLTFDTCLDKTYVGLADNKKILGTKVVENQGSTYHSAYLISTIRELLKENNVTPQNVTHIATDIGPGSFTGIRACTTVAKVMAQQLHLKTAGISSLDILAKLNNNSDKNSLVLLDARKNKSYVHDGKILGAIDLEEVKELVKKSNYSIICDDSMYNIFAEYSTDIKSYTTIEHNFAEILINLANEYFKQNPQGGNDITPLYIQPPPIFGK